MGAGPSPSLCLEGHHGAAKALPGQDGQPDRGPEVTKRRLATPILPLPRLPRRPPGRPLDPGQRGELVALQQQVRGQLLQQRLLIESIRHLPQFRGPPSRAGGLRLVDAIIARVRAGVHLVGPDPIGDLPADDPLAPGDGPQAAQLAGAGAAWHAGSGGSSAGSRSLGTTVKLAVDLNGEAPSDDGPPPLARPRPGALRGAPWPAAAEIDGEPGLTLPPGPPATSAASAQSTAGQAALAAAPPGLVAADLQQLGVEPPGREERRWIEAAVRRMFQSMSAEGLNVIAEAFREWRLPQGAAIVEQASHVTTGPGLCVLFAGVVDVLHCPKGGAEAQKVCTYDRCGQCFGELELLFEVPPGGCGGGGGAARKLHWATVATRTPATLWAIERHVLRACMSAAPTPGPPAQGRGEGAAAPELRHVFT